MRTDYLFISSYTFVIVFAILYAIILLCKFKTKRNLILGEEYMSCLFSKPIDEYDAAKAENGDNTEDVTFEYGDFEFADIVKLVEQ